MLNKIRPISICFVLIIFCFSAGIHYFRQPEDNNSINVVLLIVGLITISLQLIRGGKNLWRSFTIPAFAAVIYLGISLLVAGSADFIWNNPLYLLAEILMLVSATWIAGLYGSAINGIFRSADELILIKENGNVKTFETGLKDV